jgi:hypothetical protein
VLTVRERRDGEYHYSLHARAAPADPQLRRLNHFDDGGAAAGTDRTLLNIQPLASAVEQPRSGAQQQWGDWHNPADRKRVIDHATALVKRVAPHADVKVLKELFDDEGNPVAGKALRNLIELSFSLGDLNVTVWHELIHVLKAAGFFTPSEWAMLEKHVRGTPVAAEAARLYRAAQATEGGSPSTAPSTSAANPRALDPGGCCRATGGSGRG